MYRHIVQYNPLCCGAACMQMVYDYLGIEISQESIWADIARPNSIFGLDCDPNNMEKHFHAQSLCCLTILAIKKIDLFLSWVESQQFHAIINYVIKENHYHFILFEKVFSNGIIIQDPSVSEPNAFIHYQQLLQPQVMLVSRNTINSRCPHCKNIFPSCEAFSKIYAKHVTRCAYCKQELFFAEDIQGAPLGMGKGPSIHSIPGI